MAYRYRPKNAEVDAGNPRAWGTCDRCGFVHNLDRLTWQMSYRGTTIPQNTRLLVCQRCYDPLNAQDSPYVLSPDPVPVMNSRPGASPDGQVSYILTEDGDAIVTEAGTYIGPQIPDPNLAADATYLYSTILAPSGDVSTMYLDLFDGNPAGTGTSILSAITGSATRTDVASDLTTNAGIATNTSAISLTVSSLAVVNVSHVGFYSASTSGSLIMSGEISVSRIIAVGNPVSFQPLGLSINLN